MTFDPASDPPSDADAALCALFEAARAALRAPVLELDPQNPGHACAIGALEVLRVAHETQGRFMDDETIVRATADLLDVLASAACSPTRDAA